MDHLPPPPRNLTSPKISALEFEETLSNFPNSLKQFIHCSKFIYAFRLQLKRFSNSSPSNNQKVTSTFKPPQANGNTKRCLNIIFPCVSSSPRKKKPSQQKNPSKQLHTMNILCLVSSNSSVCRNKGGRGNPFFVYSSFYQWSRMKMQS